ncbi:MAG: hypothetical protein KGZ59_02385 [Chitinophagaceae bacterium]|nr:hypothetical protein [Chitinophagaceae bacterium]
MKSSRNKDSYQTQLSHFMNEVLVVCPSCSKMAIVKKTEAITKLICTNCGYNKLLSEKPNVILHQSSSKIIIGKYTIIAGAIDPYFHLPLWLQQSCCENIFWAYNYEHLDFLKNHIEAKLRKRNLDEISNKSIGSRLPKWMTSKKNREVVLKTIHQLSIKK